MAVLFVPINGLNSLHGVQMLIRGENIDAKGSDAAGNYLNHKMLRENKSLEDMSAADRRIWKYELQIKNQRLQHGKQEIEELRKLLDGIAVYKGPEKLKSLV